MKILWFPPAMLLPLVLASAQDQGPQNGDVAIGVRGLAGNRSSSQFNEYTDIVPGFFLQRANLNLNDLFQKKYFLSCQMRDAVRMDADYRCATGRYGKFRFEFNWNETPHDFTNTATSLFTESAPGVFTLPAADRLALQTSATNTPSLLTGAQSLDMSVARRLGSGLFTYTPTAHWTLLLQYSHEAENGFRPLGTTTNLYTNTMELPEPIKYDTNNVRVGAEYGAARGAFQAGYSTSIFTNDIPALVWQNPFNTVDAPGASSQGRMSLYPDNTAQTVDFAGAFNLTKHTRLMASVTPEWMRQNDAFLPMTINSAIIGVPQLPASSLNGNKQTLAMNYTLTSRPVSRVELTARYRSYDYNNNTASLPFSDYVDTDYRLEGLARRSLPYGYHSKDIGLEASWQFLKGQFFKVGYDFEDLERQHRDVAETQENRGSASLRLNPRKWVSLTSSWKYEDREPKLYKLNQESYPLGGNLQFSDMQNFDETARIRDNGDALLQINASDRLTFSAAWETTQDRYHQTGYGLTGDKTSDYTADLAYQIAAGVSFFADYTREQDRFAQRSSQSDTALNEWDSNIRDVIHTVAGGISALGLHEKLTLDIFYSLSSAKGNIATTALGSPLTPGFLVTTAQNYPETSNRTHGVTVDLRYRLRNNVTPRLEYRYERFTNIDFQTSPMTPYMVSLDPGTNTSLFLGATIPNYAVHIVSAVLEYRF
jgi:MtrB/PioB family decaheme-associated outer membrane protein